MTKQWYVLLPVAAVLAACGTPHQQQQQQPLMAPKAKMDVMQMRVGAPAPAAAMQLTVERSRESYTPPVANTEKYSKPEQNPVHVVAQQPISTFSIDVDTGSYSNVRRYLNNGSLPPVEAVRIEELVNYFPYDYPPPQSAQHPFAVGVEVAQSPWKTDAQLVKIGIKAVDKTLGSLPPANLVFLVDISGSMSASNKLPLVKQTLRLLTRQMRPQDRITIITYASGEELALPATSGADKEQILSVINRLQAGGSTNGSDAIQMAYREAQKNYIANGINRILLATDGDFNVGITDFKTLKGMVAEKRAAGISLTTLGFGVGNYNEHLMEQLADAGDGTYSYIDTEREARKVLQEQLTSSLATVANDVKLQVEFNPKTVSQYRLVGYENRLLRAEDFNNDNVDAGDIGAGHTVTALYEIIPVGKTGWLNSSRYQAQPAQTAGDFSQEYAYLNIRYKPVGKKASTQMSVPINAPAQGAPALSQTSNDMRFATAVASYGELLSGGKYAGRFSWNDTIALAKSAVGSDPHGLRAEFVELVETANSLSSKQPAKQ